MYITKTQSMAPVKIISIIEYTAQIDADPTGISAAISDGKFNELEILETEIAWASEKKISAQVGDGKIEDLGASADVAYQICQIGPALDQLWDDFSDEITAYVVEKAPCWLLKKLADDHDKFLADDQSDAIEKLAREGVMFLIPDEANDREAGNLYRDEAIELVDRIAHREGWNAVHDLLIPGDTMVVGHDPRIFRKNLAWHEKVAVATEKLRIEMCALIKGAAPFDFPEDTDIQIDGHYTPKCWDGDSIVCETIDGYPGPGIPVEHILDLNCLGGICDLIQEQKK